MVYKFLDKNFARVNTSGGALKSETISKQQLAEELRKPINRKFLKSKIYSSFKDNIWGANLADMQLISKYNIRIRFLLCVIDIFTKYALVSSSKEKNVIAITNAF